jgi:hypothetical protein
MPGLKPQNLPKPIKKSETQSNISSQNEPNIEENFSEGNIDE